MSAAAKKESGSESDHQLNTLTDVVRIVGETRSDVKAIKQKIEVLDHKVDGHQQENRERFDRLEQKVDQQDKRFDRLEQKVDQQDKRFDRLEQKVDQQGSDIAEIKEMLKNLTSR